MDRGKFIEMTERTLEAWNNQDVAAVLDCYTEDCTYLDPNTDGAIRGREAFGRYLSKLFQQWKMTWSMREAFMFEKGEGCAFLWHATLTPVSAGETFAIDGIDLVIVQGDKLHRNEVYFDRMSLVANK
jgi:ketosteroid isomerase-like protein